MGCCCCSSSDCFKWSFIILTSILSPILLPLIALVKLTILTHKYVTKLTTPTSANSLQTHDQKVKHVQEQVLEWNKNGRKGKMCCGRPAYKKAVWRTPKYLSTSTQIHIDLGDLIHIDPHNQTVRVEPLVRMGRLSNYLIKRGWVVPVIPEFNDLTLGGLICGTGIETSCHKYGLFQEICVEFQVVLSDGTLVNCSKDENADLFYAIPMSHGTIGFMTSATLAIIPAKKYIELEYIPCHSLDEAVSVFESQSLREEGNDYVEGIMYGLNKGVIMVGKMTNSPDPRKINSLGRWYKPWFFKHVQTFLTKSAGGEYIEYIPLRDYIHRHNKTAFWMADGLRVLQFFIWRWLFGWVLPLPFSAANYFLTTKTKRWVDNKIILQDFMVPIQHLKEWLHFSHKETGVEFTWLCPTKILGRPGMIRTKSGKEEMYVDVGIYSAVRAPGYKMEPSIKKLEALCVKHNGFQFTYADMFLSREQFYQMFDHENYNKVRKEYKCEDAFPEVYDKVSKAARNF